MTVLLFFLLSVSFIWSKVFLKRETQTPLLCDAQQEVVSEGGFLIEGIKVHSPEY